VPGSDTVGAMGTRYFTPQLFAFLRDLAANNDRDWFLAHKDDYERHVREPALGFISDLVAPLAEISPHLNVDARRNGGSLLRIHRDLRFGKERGPYHTKVGFRFRLGADPTAPTPVLYLHLEPRLSFMAAGIWRPSTGDAYAIRRLIAAEPSAWEEAAHSGRFTETFTLAGDSLVRPPKGFDPKHPLLGDLRRKDFAGVAALTQRRVTCDVFLSDFVDNSRRAQPLLAFLCRALGVPF
jgi:uncharacterized protein (TIGR02453 family)